MYFALTHIKFEEDYEKESRRRDQRILEIKRLADRVRGQFKVCAMVTFHPNSEEPLGIAVAALGTQDEKLSKLLDSIVEFCEKSGYARVQEELALIDSIDILDQQDEVNL